ncbi:tonB-system energizer ExbB [Pseudorhodoplanes sinuspersici]|uniref:Biopolymer transport protein ExbB n=1 Tax=Pseudorhodoplanes sinuspersici TaxID=1235591 RepID=A0A1W7A0L3_9HYPH|nr:tonB-system energizer ExbB [Pseudorhodoplanes sinuspersici]ARQ03130.1 tonB-system energizer ExbB [Pseudorhodoplanes sinuspersici]RKE73314.1 outer membrane transport energization protein ExbB [Pseudorhodoplanes sinuspersici]
MISLSKSLAAISGLFSTLTLSVFVSTQTAFAQTATEQAPSTAPAESAAPAASADSAAPAATPSDVVPSSGVLPDPASSTAMPDVAQQAGSIPASMLPHDLTPWGMFMQADIVVKAVMVGLAFASLVTWTVWLAKSFEIRFEKSRARKKNRWLETAKSLDEAERAFAKEKDPVARLVRAAAHEVELSQALPAEGVKERIILQLERVEASASRRISNGMGILATIGATSPFVGLFGTVWGIMNSFIGISKAHTTSLAVVAPGIAEALLATAIGLVAAIPAVVIYNMFTRSIGGYRLILGNASANVLRLASRDLDRGDMKLQHTARQAAE